MLFVKKSLVSQLNLFSISLQNLREAIHEEYREVVERRVFTGLSCLLIISSFLI